MTYNPRRANGHRRDQVTRRVKAEEHDCWLCGLPVDQTLGKMPGIHSDRCLTAGRDCTGCVYHPKSPVVDELLPVSRGGSPIDRANCRLAHRDCNRDRSNKLEYDRPEPKPFVTSRQW